MVDLYCIAMNSVDGWEREWKGNGVWMMMNVKVVVVVSRFTVYSSSI